MRHSDGERSYSKTKQRRAVMENDLIRKPNKGERLINAPRLGEVRFAWHDARSPRRKVAHSSEEPPP